MNRNQQRWIVLKFGGTSVSSAENWTHITSVIRSRLKQGYRVCIVHSALSGISNHLQYLIDKAPTGTPEQAVDEIKQRHRDLAAALDLNANELLGEYFLELEQLVKGIRLVEEASPRIQARLMSLGELMSTTLGAAYLNRQDLGCAWTDARTLLESIPQKNVSERAKMLSAICDADSDEELLRRFNEEENEVILTQGFIASDSEGQTVLLGRGGSDVSASYFAARLGAERLEIWTDVPGMFSSNPHEISSARLLKSLSYEEAQEIATNGAKVLHPRCIRPARRHEIPIHIKCTQKPELEGTVITSAASEDEALVKAIAVRPDIILVSLESLGMWQQVGFLADAFGVFKRFGLSIDLVSTSESNVTVSLDPGVNTHFQDIREDFIEELSRLCRVRIIESAAAVSLLGRHIRTILHQLGPAFEVFQEHEVYLVSQAANDLNFTFVVDSEQAGRLVRQLHEQVISQAGNQQAFGLTWLQLTGEDEPAGDRHAAWWRTKREELISLVKENGPVYVYDGETIRENISRLKELNRVDQVLYAVKANVHPEVLNLIFKQGLGFDCVSIDEAERIFELFPEIDPERILFTPNFAPRSEYERGLERGVHVTLDNIFPLQQWPELFEGRELFLRIDPGHGSGHHKHVKTGGIHSKFGIPLFEIGEVQSIIERIGARVKGLHAHVGSGIKDPEQWKTTATILHEVAEQLGGVEILDLGGGFGIRENETQSSLDLDQVNASLAEFKEAHPKYTLWVEPGRFLVATAGVLLAHVTQLKGKGSVRYVGVDTGMNSLIRPALYGARHTIVNLSRLNEPANQVVNIVGPICESADKLGIDRLFPESEEGDVVLIANTGAYGKVMSSSYNLRQPAGEVVI